VWWASPHLAGYVALIPTVIGIFLIVHQMTLHDVMNGVTLPGGGVNFAASMALSKGHLPYDNFVLAQPPGMAIVLLPFAWAAHSGGTGPLSAARIFTAFLAVVNVFLAGCTARHHGIASTFIAGVLFALVPYSLFATSSVTVGPYLVLFCYLAFQAAFTQGELASGGRLVLAGALIGFAMVIKPWAVIPAIVLVVCAVIHWREALLRVLGGLVLGIGVPCVLFFLAAPGAFLDDVIGAELRTGTGHSVSTVLSQRVAELLGLGTPVGMTKAGGIAIGVGILLAVLILVAVFARGSSSTMLDWALLATTIGLVVVGLLVNQLPFIYTYFVAAFAVVLIGNSVGTLLSLASSFTPGKGDLSGTVAAGATVFFVAVMIAIVAVATPKEADFEKAYFLAHASNSSAAIEAHVPAGTCVVSNSPEALIVAGLFAKLPAGCPYVVDPGGIEKVAGSPALGTNNLSVVTQWEQIFSLARYVVIAPGPPPIPFSPQLRRYFARNFKLVYNSRYRIFENTSTALTLP
jgi:alpha-1,2-mannosyltransferase